jgi:hypothetical protein
LTIDAIHSGNEVLAHISGGSPPYEALATFGPEGRTQPRASRDGWVTFRFDEDARAVLPLVISVKDNRGGQTVKAPEWTAEELQTSGWKSPPQPELPQEQ